MNEVFKIYVEQLRHGRTEEIAESLTPNFIDLAEKELSFIRDVQIAGEAYLADENLILHLKVAACATIPCSICNEAVEVEIFIPNFYHVEPIAEIKTGIFDFTQVLREAILLEVPKFAECHNGKCPNREKIEKFLKVKSENGIEGSDDEDGYQPFADLNLDKYKPTK